MTGDELRKSIHRILALFVEETKNDNDPVTDSVKATVAQFILNTKTTLWQMNEINGGHLTTSNLIDAQIQELRRCVMDLTKLESFNNHHEEMKQ